VTQVEQAQQDYLEAIRVLFHARERYRQYPRSSHYYERVVAARLDVWKARQRLEQLRVQAGQGA